MLENKTSKMVEELKALMDLCVKQIDVSDIKKMDAASLAGIQSCLKLTDSACELAIEQARIIDELNDKLDKVLRILGKMNES